MASPIDPLDELLVAIGAGDQRAFRRLYDAVSSRLLGILVARIGRRDLAEEVLQECFIKIWQRAHTYQPSRGHAMPWLASLVRHQAIDLVRRRRPVEMAELSELDAAQWADDGADPQRDAELSQCVNRLREPLANLAPQIRTSVLLTCYAGYTQSESALLMQAPLGTLKSWVRRGLGNLRGELPGFQA